ncbi:MAG: DUF3592 domain-containing protein [Fimbriimonas sp.]
MATRLVPQEAPEPAPQIVAAPTVWPRPKVPAYGPRVVRLTKATEVASVVLGTVAALIAIGGGLVLTKQWRDGDRLLREGQVVAAKIVDREIRRGDGKSYRLHYEFAVGGKTIRDVKRVNRRTFEAMSRTETVPVTALPQKPELHRYGVMNRKDFQRDMGLGILGVLAATGLFGGILLMVRVSASRELKILQDWSAVSGQVLGVQKRYGGKQGTAYRVNLRYPTTGNQIFTTELSATRPADWAIAPGDYLDVLYDPENPERVRIRETLTTVEVDPSTY